jgi:hypothetical protein
MCLPFCPRKIPLPPPLSGEGSCVAGAEERPLFGRYSGAFVLIKTGFVFKRRLEFIDFVRL